MSNAIPEGIYNYSFSSLLSGVWTGLEPATPCVTGRYSNQLNYHTKVLRCFRMPFLLILPSTGVISVLRVQSYESFPIYANFFDVKRK